MRIDSHSACHRDFFFRLRCQQVNVSFLFFSYLFFFLGDIDLEAEAKNWTVSSAERSLSISSVQSLSRVRLFATPWTATHQTSMSITNSRSLNSDPSNQWWHPKISSFVIPFSSHLNLSQHQGLFQRVSSSHQVAKLLEF